MKRPRLLTAFLASSTVLAVATPPALAQGPPPPFNQGRWEAVMTKHPILFNSLLTSYDGIIERDPYVGGMSSFGLYTPMFSKIQLPMRFNGPVLTEANTSMYGPIEWTFRWTGSEATKPDRIYIRETIQAKYNLTLFPHSRKLFVSAETGDKNERVSWSRSPVRNQFDTVGWAEREIHEVTRLIQKLNPPMVFTVRASPASRIAAEVDPVPDPGSSGGLPYGQAVGTVSASYSAVEDNRAATLSCPPMEEGGNWRKGPNGERVQNVRNQDGSMVVDSVATWNDAVPHHRDPATDELKPIPAGWKISADLIVNATNIPTGITNLFDTRVDWSLEGEGAIDNHWHNKWSNQLYSSLYPQSVEVSDVSQTPLWPTGKVSNITVDVADLRTGYEAVTTNTYTIRWHAPYENWTKWGTSFTQAEDVTFSEIAEPGYASDNGSIHCKWLYDQWMLAAGFEASNIVLSVLGNGAATSPVEGGFGGLLSSLLAAANAYSQQYAPTPEEGSANFDDCMNAPDSKFLGDGGKADVEAHPERYRMYPKLKIGYKVQPWQGDHYTGNGFAGIVKQGLAHRMSVQWYGIYELEEQYRQQSH